MSGNFLVRGDETHRVEFDGGAWVDIRRCISRGERLDMMKKVRTTKSRQVLNPNNKRMESIMEVGWDDDLYGRLLLRTIIVDWSDEEPLTPENIDKTPENMAAYLLQEFDRLNPTDPNKDEELGKPAAASSDTESA